MGGSGSRSSMLAKAMPPSSSSPRDPASWSMAAPAARGASTSESGRWGPGGAETLLALQQSGAARRVLSAGQRLWVGDALVTVVNPDGQPSASPNDDSLVLRLDWRTVSVLLTGDLGWQGEARVLARGGPVRVLALRVAHHGSRFSSSAPFLESARPAFAIISAGARNPFRHPTPEALARLEAAGARIYRTDRDGAIIIETDGVHLSFF